VVHRIDSKDVHRPTSTRVTPSDPQASPRSRCPRCSPRRNWPPPSAATKQLAPAAEYLTYPEQLGGIETSLRLRPKTPLLCGSSARLVTAWVTRDRVEPAVSPAMSPTRMPSHRIKSDLVSHFGDSTGPAALLRWQLDSPASRCMSLGHEAYRGRPGLGRRRH
jgi:hypothetical protein